MSDTIAWVCAGCGATVMRHPAMPAPGRRCLECVQKAKSEVKRVRREKRLVELKSNPRTRVVGLNWGTCGIEVFWLVTELGSVSKIQSTSQTADLLEPSALGRFCSLSKPYKGA